jgi:hypothetical protein
LTSGVQPSRLSMQIETEIARLVGRRVKNAMREWLRGFPHEEIALLNHVSASFRRRPGCRVPGPPPCEADSDWQPLHRRGPMGRDLLGCDLAISVMLQPRNQLKTAFLQLKAGDSYLGSVNPQQLECTRISPLVASRSYIVHVNSTMNDVRVSDTAYLVKKLPTSRPVSFHSNRWLTLEDWLTAWLQCRVGATSLPGDASGPEALLSYYATNRVPYFGFSHAEFPPELADAIAQVPAGAGVANLARGSPLVVLTPSSSATQQSLRSTAALESCRPRELLACRGRLRFHAVALVLVASLANEATGLSMLNANDE